MVKKSLCTVANSRGEHQRNNMEQALKEGVCLFCPKYIAKYHASPIERKGEFWSITKNDYPYDGTKIHYLFIANRHINSLKQLSPKALAELAGHLKWLEQKHRLLGGTILLRFGDSQRSCSSIEHLHGHLIVGGRKRPGKELLMVKAGFKK